MPRIPGFDFDYDCISDGEAFQRNHEYGDNYIDLKALKEVRNFKKVVGTVIIKNSSLAFYEFFTGLVEFCLNIRRFLCNHRQSPVNLMQFKIRRFQ